MKPSRRILLTFFLILLIAAFLIKPLLIFSLQKAAQRIFPQSKITIGSINLRQWGKISLSGLEVIQSPSIELKIKNADLSLARGGLKLFLGQGTLKLNLSRDKIREIEKLAKPEKKLPPPVSLLELSDFRFELIIEDIKIEGAASLKINPRTRVLNYAGIKIDSLQVSGVKLEEAYLEAGQNDPAGSFRAKNISYNKITLEDISGSARLMDKTLYLDSLSARLLEGTLSGNAALELISPLSYSARIKLNRLDIARAVTELKLAEKVSLSGKIGGQIALEGKAGQISLLEGNLDSPDSGGTLDIKDTRFLENIARGSGKSLDIIVESFKNYHYNIGNIKLSLEEGNLAFDINLDGEKGKRNLSIVLHGVPHTN